MKVSKFFRGVFLVLRHGPCQVVEWRELAVSDGLTGLCSRAFFTALANFAIADAQRSAKSVGLLSIDLNKFKSVNDNEGHAVGDRVLKDAAKIIRSVCRRETDIICRWGGDEFVVLLPQTNIAVARAFAAQLSEATILSPGGQSVTLSCGATGAAGRNISLDVLLEAADKEMYAQKSAQQR